MDTQSMIVYGLVFGAVLCLVLGIKNMLPDKSAQELSDRLPAFFRIFGFGIFFFAAEAGRIMEGMFPDNSKRIEESLRRGDLPGCLGVDDGLQVGPAARKKHSQLDAHVSSFRGCRTEASVLIVRCRTEGSVPIVRVLLIES